MFDYALVPYEPKGENSTIYNVGKVRIDQPTGNAVDIGSSKIRILNLSAEIMLDIVQHAKN